MSDEEVTQEAPVTPASPDTGPDLMYVPHGVSPSEAVAAFMDWLNNRDERSGPFGVHWGAEPGIALVAEFCDLQGW